MSNKPKLKYAIDPHSVYYTRDSHNPSIAILTISASNITEEDIHIDAFEVKIPVNENINAENALVASAKSITTSSLSKEWGFSGDSGVYRAAPIQPFAVIKAGQSLTFYLKNIIVNNAEGTALIDITEKSGDDFATYTQEVIKTKSDLEIKTFYVNPSDIASGEASTLSWTTNAARVTLGPGNFPDIQPTDSVIVHPTLTTTYTLTAFGEGPAISEQKTVQIAPPKIFFEVSKKVIDAGDKVTLTWKVTNARTVEISYFPDREFALEGHEEVELYKETDFTLRAITSASSGDSYERTLTVKINPVKIISFNNKTEQGPLVLEWEMQSAAKARIEKSSKNHFHSEEEKEEIKLKGNYYPIPTDQLKKGFYLITENPEKSTTYTLTADNEINYDMRDVIVNHSPSAWRKVLPVNFPYRKHGILDIEVVLNFNNKLWSINPDFTKVAYSADGINWHEVKTNLPWFPNEEQVIGTVYKDRMWLIGGRIDDKIMVCSTDDGINWKTETDDAGFTMQSDFTCFVIPGIDKIFVAGSSMKNEEWPIWSSPDGKSWTKNPKPISTEPGYEVNTVVAGNKVYAMGTKTTQTPYFITPKIFTSTNGEDWTNYTIKGRFPIDFYRVCVIEDTLYVFENHGGKYIFYSIDDGVARDMPPFPVSEMLHFVAVTFNNSLWCMHGINYYGGGKSEIEKNIHLFTP